MRATIWGVLRGLSTKLDTYTFWEEMDICIKDSTEGFVLSSIQYVHIMVLDLQINDSANGSKVTPVMISGERKAMEADLSMRCIVF